MKRMKKEDIIALPDARLRQKCAKVVSVTPDIENLVKNAIDAMKGKGKLALEIEQEGDYVKINVSDTGSGIQKNQFKTIFEPGFTTKKRGWGLGLSLTKRIVEEYHKGTIKVLHSEIGKGTTMQVILKQ